MVPVVGFELETQIFYVRIMTSLKGFLAVVIIAAFHPRPCLSPCIASQLGKGRFQYEKFGWTFLRPQSHTHVPFALLNRGNKTYHIKYTANLTLNAVGPHIPRITMVGVTGENQSRNAMAPQESASSKHKRQTIPVSLGGNTSMFGLQKKEEVLRADDSLSSLLRAIVNDYLEGCDLIGIFDQIFKGSKTLETLVSFPGIKQVLQLVYLEDLTEKIEWESQNCVGTFLLLSEPDLLISFGNINRFHWSYKAKVIIVGLPLPYLEMFLTTVKGRKTEHIIGVVEDTSNNHFKIYMNLLFWGEGLKRMADWAGDNYTRKANLFPDKITNLKLADVQVVVFEWRPILFYERYEDGSIKKRHGKDITLVETLGEVFNYTLVYVDIPPVYGGPLPNGTWTGLVGVLGRDEAHLGLTHLFASGLNDRHKVQDYSRPMEEDRGCFLIRLEAPIPPWQAPILPFQLDTWIAFIVGLVVSGPIFYAIVMASSKVGEEHHQFKSLAYTSLFTVGIHFEHPLVVLPKQLSSQVFIVFLLIYNLILSTGYRSNLISFLTVARPPKRLETFKDLYESGLPIRTFPWWANALNESDNPNLRRLLDRYEVRLATEEELLPEVMDVESSAAIISSRANLEVISSLTRTKNGKPVVRFLKECVASFSVGIGLQWHTPLKPKFNKVMGKLVESGLIRLWFIQSREEYRKLAEREGKVTYYEDLWHDNKDGLIPLTIGHTQSIFIIMGFGYFLAAIAFGVEVICN